MATREIATDLKLTGERQFNDAMKSVNSGLKVLKSEMGAVTSEFGKNDASMSQNIRISKNLRAQNEQQKEVIRAATIALKQNEEAYGKDSKQADKFRTIIANAQTQINKNNAELKKHNATLQALRSIGKGAETAMHGVKGAISGAGAAAGVAAKGIGSLVKISTAGAAAVGALGVAGATALVSFAKAAADDARAAQDAIDAAKAAGEAYEPLTAAQEQWLAFSDQLSGLDAAVSGAKNALGGVLLPMLSELSGDGTKLLNDFTTEFQAAAGDTKKQGQLIGKYAADGAKLLLKQLPEFARVAKELVKGLGDGLKDGGLEELVDTGIELVEDILNGIIDAAPSIAEGATKLIEKMVEKLSGDGAQELLKSAVGMVTSLVQGLADSAPTLIPAIGNMIMTIVTTLAEAAPDLLLAGADLILGIITGIGDALPQMWEKAKEAGQKFIDGMDEKADDFKRIGTEILEKIKDGLKEAWDAFCDWWLELWNGLPDPEINSDFGVTKGDYYIPGYAMGLDRVPYDNFLARLHKDEMVLTKEQAAAYRSGQTDGAAVTGGSTGGYRVVNLTVNAQQLTQADIEMIVRTVNEQLGEAI